MGYEFQMDYDFKALNSDFSMLYREWKSIFDGEGIKGGEGVLYINKSRAAGSSYWVLTCLSVRGRPAVLWPVIAYVIYASGLTIGLMTTNADDSARYNSIFKSLSTGLNLIGISLFFLQTFRTNSSYQVWYSARTSLGQVLTGIRSIMSHVAAGHLKSLRLSRRMLRWCAALMQCAKLTVRGKHKDITSLKETLSANEYSKLNAIHSGTRWLFCLQQIEEIWAEGKRAYHPVLSCLLIFFASSGLDLNVLHKVMDCMMRDDVAGLRSNVGAMMRINSTPMPYAYIVHLRAFMIVWLMVLPLIFIPDLGYFAIMLSSAIAIALIGMEAISLEIESPYGRDFNDLPVDELMAQDFEHLKYAYAECAKLPHDTGSDADDLGGVDWNVVPKTASGSQSMTPVNPQKEWTSPDKATPLTGLLNDSIASTADIERCQLSHEDEHDEGTEILMDIIRQPEKSTRF